MINKIGRTIREDGIIVSTVQPMFMAWYGNYETAISFNNQLEWRIAEAYETLQQAKEGHLKYVNMSKEDLENTNWIG